MTAKRASNGESESARDQGQYRPRVIVKFRDHISLPHDRTAANQVEKLGIGSWKRLEEDFKGITLGPLFASKKPDEIRELVNRGMEMDPTYRPPDFLSYFAVNVPAGVDPEEVAKALSQWESVQISYVEPPPVEPPVVNPADDPRSVNQGYLDPSPDGIDAEYAWASPGGAGAGQALVDLEWGWTFTHEDLAAHGITLISGINTSFFFHGTSVLGEVAAVDNTVGCVGITPEIASVRCVSQWLSGGGYSTSQPILDAIAAMNFGDVLLLEAQTSLYGYVKVPVEIEPAVFDVIRLATALGIVVVQAGGNGGVDLGTVTNPAGEQIFNRGSADFRDSGAIIVGAGSSTAPHTRLGFSCFGSRIVCTAGARTWIRYRRTAPARRRISTPLGSAEHPVHRRSLRARRWRSRDLPKRTSFIDSHPGSCELFSAIPQPEPHLRIRPSIASV